MVKQAVERYRSSIRLACKAFAISETCYRYQPVQSDENTEIADWLIPVFVSEVVVFISHAALGSCDFSA